MNFRLCWLILVVLCVPGCDRKEDTPTPSTGKSSSGNPITAPVDYLGAVGAAQKQAEKTLDLTTLNQAVRAFQAGEDRLPSSLQELVSEGYLPRLPAVPRGMQFVYNPQTGQVGLRPAAPAPSAPKPQR